MMDESVSLSNSNWWSICIALMEEYMQAWQKKGKRKINDKILFKMLFRRSITMFYLEGINKRDVLRVGKWLMDNSHDVLLRRE